MKARPNLPISGAALLLLVAASPALASHSSRASRAEIEATRQLNLQAAEQARAPQPAQVAAKDAAANVPDNTPPVAAPTAPIQSAQMAPPAP